VKNFDPGWVGSIFCPWGQVSHLWFGFGKFPPKNINFCIFALTVKKISLGTWVKGWSVSYLLRVKSRLWPSFCKTPSPSHGIGLEICLGLGIGFRLGGARTLTEVSYFS